MRKFSESVINNIVTEILKVKENKNQILIALDGPSAGGKTTLASILCDIFDADVIHMDDFFLPTHMRTEERYNTPGGNVHYERFLSDVLIPLSKHNKYHYTPYNCKTMSYGLTCCIAPKDITIIEGSYSCHPILSKYYDLKIYIDIDPESQFQRILRRNGSEKAQIFKDKWIPLENIYHSTFDIKGNANIIVDIKESQYE